LFFYCFFFFFQAEDGIRDGHVTGVQTCALPISILSDYKKNHFNIKLLDIKLKYKNHFYVQMKKTINLNVQKRILTYHIKRNEFRSEERRVGKECRSR